MSADFAHGSAAGDWLMWAGLTGGGSAPGVSHPPHGAPEYSSHGDGRDTRRQVDVQKIKHNITSSHSIDQGKSRGQPKVKDREICTTYGS